MATEKYKDDLSELYQNEIIGEVLCDRLLATCEDSLQRYKIATMLQLETETKARLRPVLLSLGIDVAENPASVQGGEQFAEAVGSLPWPEFVVALRDAIKPYVERYKEMAAAAPKDHQDTFDLMVRHEQAFYSFCELEASGNGDESLDAVIEELQFPLPKPS